MNFEDFKKDIENKLAKITDFELQEFHFEAYDFGSGTLSYRIKGRNHKFTFDGRENKLTWNVSKPHQKYSGAIFSELLQLEGLIIEEEILRKKI
jgi:hypothetical protein